MTVALDTDAVRTLTTVLGGGGLAIIPTDTVYGLACDPHRPAAIRRLHILKGRPAPRPAAVLFGSVDAAAPLLGSLGPRTRGAAAALLPGPVTLVLPDAAGDWAVAGGAGTVGLRVPSLAGRLAPLSALGVAVLQTSANPTGRADVRRLDEIDSGLRAGVDLVVDAGTLPGRASTIVDLSDYERTGRWRTLRDGALDSARVQAALGSPTD